jgi:histidinol-phosphate aminotransferase
MLPFLRSDLAQLIAYTPHPGGASGSPSASASSAIASSPVLLDRLDTNESPDDLPDEIKHKLAWMFQQLESNRYPDGGHQRLKAAIGEYVNESAQLTAEPITPAEISVGNGSDELIRSLLIATCLGGAGAILVAQPTFSMYAILAKTLAIPVVTVGRSSVNFEIDLEAAQAAVAQQSPIRAVFVVHPNSPTANALTAAELHWLRDLPDRILVVIDEAYFEFSQTTVVAELKQRPNWIVLRTFSKAFRLAAHRVGYAIGHPELIAALEKVRLPYNLPSFSQAAALLALQQRQSLLAAIPTLLAERERLLQSLTAMAELQVWQSDANFVFVRLKTDAAAAADRLFQQLKAQGTLVRQINGGFRITVGTAAENQRTCDHLKAALKQFAG